MIDELASSKFPAFVLSLKSNFRGKGLITKLTELNLDVNIVWGLEINEFEDEFLKSLIDMRKSKYILRRGLSLGELSCALGHLQMYEEFLLTNKEWGLFLEDDALIQTSFDALLINLPISMPPTIVTLASARDQRFEPQPFPFLKSELNLGVGHRFRKCAVAPVLAHAYLMNRSGAVEAAHALRGRRIYSPADFPFQFRNRLSFYASEDGYVITDNQLSTLDADRLEEITRGKRGKWRAKVERRSRVIFDNSGFGVLLAKLLGLSARDYAQERIKSRWEYKKYLRGNSEKFIR